MLYLTKMLFEKLRDPEAVPGLASTIDFRPSAGDPPYRSPWTAATVQIVRWVTFVRLRRTPIDAVRLWLAEYAGSLDTLRSYRKEAVRLLVWATRGMGKPLFSLNREDLLAYEAFLGQPSVEWIEPMLPRQGGARQG